MYTPKMIHDATPDNMRRVAEQYENLPMGGNFITEVAFFRTGADALEKVTQVEKILKKREALGDEDTLDIIQTLIDP